jgi:acyl dehydratase
MLILDSPDDLHAWVGKEIAVTDWLPVTQERIQHFAESTGDKQWIHTDMERASRESPFGVTIAHGFLTLSLLSYFLRQVIEIRGVRMAINYGLNRVRFPAPVRLGSKIRARFTLQALKKLADATEIVFAVAIEDQSGTKPCCAAEWIVRYYQGLP